MSMSTKYWAPDPGAGKRNPAVNGHEDAERVYMPVQQLALGMYVVGLGKPWVETSFAGQGFELQTEEELEAVKKVCEFVYVDKSKERKPESMRAVADDMLAAQNGDFRPPPPRISDFAEEFTRAEKVHRQVRALVADVMDGVEQGRTVDCKLVKAAVAECVDSILHSPDAFLWLSQLKNPGDYTAQHSMNVCVLAIVLGRHLGLSAANLSHIGLCGMLFDVGKMRLPAWLLNKQGKLNAEEQAIMRSHTSLGYEVLVSCETLYPGVAQAALLHHEALDGSGYPNRVPQQDIPFFTRVVAIADVYDAITSDRIYQPGRTHLEAINSISNLSGSRLDGALVAKFIEALGVYPPGVVVKMSNDAIGIVVEVNEKSKLRPKVIMLMDGERRPMYERVVDLAQMPLDALGRVLAIKSIVKAKDYGIDIAKYYHQGILHKGFALSAA